MYPAERLRSVLVTKYLASHHLPVLPVDCVSDIWQFALPCLVAFTAPEKVAIGVQASPSYKRPDGSGLLLLRRWKRYQCGLFEARSSGDSIRHNTLNVGFLLCLAMEASSGALICIEKNTGCSCRFTDWQCSAEATSEEVQPSRVSWDVVLGHIGSPVFCSDGAFYGLSWQGASVIRVVPYGATETFYDCGGTRADALAIFERDGQTSRILLLHRPNGRSSSSTLSAISMDGKSLGTIAEIDLVGCDLDVDNNQGLCFVVGYYSGSNSPTVCIIDLLKGCVRTHVALPNISLLDLFVRDDGGLWIITEQRDVEALDSVYI
ncbi:hypothetical protein FOL47_006810 [Perkinsus chesapeaki]|uniref:Uncharacterized protein n=1 Tax=Perkinsus chesapeaki TaxID=330153 RepID=A0A7J6MXQ5_PERCH|nr:hypothetical protein FOL47_006810 [Perkinsus chesapeaki]